ncbi:MAG: hypothetical protein IJT91_02135, partial [Clostridia bacterium]|nr:hypothetical protein [Clostridia bacterium]
IGIIKLNSRNEVSLGDFKFSLKYDDNEEFSHIQIFLKAIVGGKTVKYFTPGYINTDTAEIGTDILVIGQHGTKYNYVSTIDTNAEIIVQTGDKVKFDYNNSDVHMIVKKFNFGHIGIKIKE